MGVVGRGGRLTVHARLGPSWMWCLTTHDAAWYMLEPSRSTETIHAVLGEFEGVVVCDAYSCYASLAAGSKGKLRLAHCFAHARRKFYELRTTHPALCKQAQTPPRPRAVRLDLLDPIFLLERELRRRPGEDVAQQLLPGFARERAPAVERLVQGDAEAELIGEGLGGHIERRADHHAGAGQVRVDAGGIRVQVGVRERTGRRRPDRRRVGRSREAEVDDAGAVVDADQHVLGLEVNSPGTGTVPLGRVYPPA